MSSEIVFTAVFEEVENGWVQARLVEIPGVITAAPTRDEAHEALVDAFAEYLRSFADEPVEEAAVAASSQVSIVITAA